MKWFKAHTRRIVLMTLLLVITAHAPLFAGQQLALDRTFGNRGRVTINSSQTAQHKADSVILQPDGKIVTLISYTIPRGCDAPELGTLLFKHEADGSPDRSFGENGSISIETAHEIDGEMYLSSAAVQKDGKIVVCKHKYFGTGRPDDFSVLRYNADGTPDETFGNGGVVASDFEGLGGSAWRIALQSDGKIVLAGVSAVENGVKTIAVVRYNPDGSPDQSFAGAGKWAAAFAAGFATVEIDPTGRIVVMGQSSDQEIAIARLQTDGTPDNAFGEDGIVRTKIASTNIRGEDIEFLPEGKMIITGSAEFFPEDNEEEKSPEKDMLVIAYSADGSLDPGFGSEGFIIGDFQALETGRRTIYQTCGNIIVAAERYSPSANNYELIMLRYDLNGTLDQSFGVQGVAKANPFRKNETPIKVAGVLQSGKWIISGQVEPDLGGCSETASSSRDVALERYELR